MEKEEGEGVKVGGGGVKGGGVKEISRQNEGNEGEKSFYLHETAPSHNRFVLKCKS